MTIAIRRVRPADAELLRAARLRALADSPDAFGQTLDAAREQPLGEWQTAARQSSSGDRRAWFVAERVPDRGGPSRVVGVVFGRRRPPEELMVFSMWVDPDERRQGVGRALIEAVEQWAATWGATSTVLWVFAANEPALRFYLRLGFSLDHAGPDADAGSPHGALAMHRAIRVIGSSDSQDPLTPTR
jgi:GNAT superfamily N-acetyltransferase